MSNSNPSHSCRSLAGFATAASIFLGFVSPAHAVPNNSVTQQVWGLKYGVTSAQLADNAWLNQDADGDGVKNKDEIGAGTNPFDAGKTIKVKSITKNGALVDLKFDTEVGKLYRVEKTATLGGTWEIQAGQVPGNGGERALTVAYAANCFFRVRVEDLDTDNDTVSDWAETQASLNPALAQTVPGVNDRDYVNGQLALPNVVKITATDAFASEDGPQAGSFTVTRTQKLLAVTVNLAISGTAMPSGAGPNPDYAALPASVNFAAGAAGADSVTLPVNPTQDPSVKGSRSVTASLNATNLYELGAPSSATVIIYDSTVASGTGLLGQYFDTASTTYGNAANFDAAQLKVTRVDPTVNFNWMQGTPAAVISAANPTDFSATWEGYLHPTTAGSYQFQLDADDKARVLLDLDGNGNFDLPGEQIIEHGWDGPATVGTFKQSVAYALVIPAGPANRYRIRVEFVDATGDARCRLQWRAGTAAFANIASTNVFTHTQALATTGYSFTRTNATTGTIVVTPTGGHALAVGNQVDLTFSSGNLFSPDSYNGSFTISAVNGTTTFTVPITGTNLPASGTGTGFLSNSASTTAGLLAKFYPNATFSGSPTLIRVDTAVTLTNNGIWGAGSPDPSIAADTFSARWTGQVQPQFSEVYTFIVNADDSAKLWINGQPQSLLVASALNSAGTYSYNGTTGLAVITPTSIPPNSFSVGEIIRVDPTSGNLNYGTATYSYDGATGDAVINYSALTNITAGGFGVGEKVFLDPTTGNLSALGSLEYTINAATSSPKTFTTNFGTGVFATGTGSMAIADLRDAVVMAVTPTTFTVDFGTGKSATGTGNCNVDWTNKPIDWPTSTTIDRYARIPLQGGVRYDIKLEYFENATTANCQLFWYSPSQPRQVIPQARLYPSNGPLAPAAHVSPTDASALVGGPFSFKVEGSNGANVTVSGNPAWLTYGGGFLTGTPPGGSAGDYQVIITVTNASGTSTSVLNLHVDNVAGTIVREHWSGVGGTTVVDIPTGIAATGTASLASLEGPSDFGDDYGARVRGYITAPASGNYYFWIAASNAAELWISNDDEPVNASKRAWVTNGTASQEWNKAGETNQKSPWLALESGKRYYIEILHKAGVGTDNLAVGWLKPGQTGTAPSQVVPGYVLSPYVAPAPGSTPGTLYVATMLSQNGAATTGVGTSTLRLNEDETIAYMKHSYSGLTGPITSQHIHTDPYLSKPSTIVYDIDTPDTAGDGLITDPNDPNFGAHKWTITAMGTLSVAEIREIIKQGKAYINLHTALNPAGEIRGNYSLADGSRTFTPPPPPPVLADDSNTNNGAVRFLTQATYGANPPDIAALRAIVPPVGKTRYEAWIDDQFTKSASHQLPEVIASELANVNGQFADSLTYNAWWRNSIAGDDQLRQRIAFALSEIHVVSTAGPLSNNARAVSYFYDKLADNAFGNFRDLLEDTTLTAPMGRYLDMLRNDKPDQSIGRIPNENYAREIKQLFSIGLFRMWPDGSLMLNSKDELIPTYTQNEIIGYAHVFTGWDYGYDGPVRTTFSAATVWTRQMRDVPARHFTGPKRILNNEVLPGLQTVGTQPLDPFATPTATQYNTAAFKALPVQELDATHDQLFNHPNTGPFICRQLIQRLVTSHPSRDYVYRVVQKFNDNGSGVRGDMKAVIKAILLDYEARNSVEATKAAFGKQREPIMRVAAATRAFRTNGFSGSYAQTSTGTSNRTISITTATPHRLNSGNSVFLDFTGGSPAPYSGIYSVVAITGVQATSTAFTVNATGLAAGTYSQAAGSSSITITITSHWLAAGHKCYLDFQSGGAAGVAGLDGAIHTVVTSSGETSSTFTIAAPDTTAKSGSVIMPRFTPGSYQVSSSGLAAPNDRRIRLNANHDHHMNVGDPIFLNFSGPNGTIPTDAQFVVESVVDNTTFTVLGASTSGLTTQSDNGIWMFPLLSQPLNRSGTIAARASTFNMGVTNADITQTPLNSPTVFNYFLPDFKFPGTLASQAITTPEFQLTSDTNVVRHTNFLYSGVFNPANTNGISSFKTGGNALVMDLGPWMGNAVDIGGLGVGPQPAQAWTSNANLSTLIERMNVLLLAGQLSSTAKTTIQTFVSNTTNVPYTDATPTDTQKRDRIRSIIHLIITSADFTIQR